MVAPLSPPKKSFLQAVQYPDLLTQIQNSQERAALSERVCIIRSINVPNYELNSCHP